MARQLRLEYAGACFHVINRGNYRRDLFAPKGAAEAFEQVLLEAAQTYRWRVHAYVIMRNHFHLAVELTEPNLSLGMKWLQGTWAVRFNRFRGEAGRPFQGRYKALHVEPGPALAQVCHYIHLNPVNAKVVTAGQLREFRWSSLHWYLGGVRPAGLTAQTLLRESGRLTDTNAGWRKYLGYLGLLAEEDPEQREERYGRLSRGWCVGTAEFRQSLRKELQEQGGDQAAWRGECAAEWEDKLQQAAKALAIKLAKLPARKSAPEKVRLAVLLRKTTAVSNGWLAKRLQMGPAASVSQYVRRFRLAGEDRQPGFAKALSSVSS